jgi:hypothetical protein
LVHREVHGRVRVPLVMHEPGYIAPTAATPTSSRQLVDEPGCRLTKDVLWVTPWTRLAAVGGAAVAHNTVGEGCPWNSSARRGVQGFMGFRNGRFESSKVSVSNCDNISIAMVLTTSFGV